MYFEVIPFEIPPIALWVGALCLISAVVTIVWLALRSSRKDQGERSRQGG